MISDRFEKIPTSYDFGYGKTGSVVVFGGVEYCYKVAVDDDVDDDDDDDGDDEEEEEETGIFTGFLTFPELRAEKEL